MRKDELIDLIVETKMKTFVNLAASATDRRSKKRKHSELSNAEENDAWLKSLPRAAEVNNAPAKMGMSVGSASSGAGKRALPAFLQSREAEVRTKRAMPAFLKSPPNVQAGKQ